eukprot:5783369-Karenia_brevis.AAC.1
METVIFTSHPLMQQTLEEAVQKATREATQAFEARITQALSQGPFLLAPGGSESPPCSSTSSSTTSPIPGSLTPAKAAAGE